MVAENSVRPLSEEDHNHGEATGVGGFDPPADAEKWKFRALPVVPQWKAGRFN